MEKLCWFNHYTLSGLAFNPDDAIRQDVVGIALKGFHPEGIFQLEEASLFSQDLNF